ncbi:MAG: DUF2062 domain-containing protein [Thermoanaerobaculia bacterium]
MSIREVVPPSAPPSDAPPDARPEAPSPSSEAALSPNQLRLRRFREKFLHMVGRDDPPEIVAASFALGVAISFTPLIGLHWVIALVLALILKLNKFDVLLGTLVVNPLTLPPVAWVAIHLGRFLLRARREAITHLPWTEFFHRSFWVQAGPRMKVIGIQWAVGMFTLSFIAGALTYVFFVRILRMRRERERAACARATSSGS